MIRAEQSLKVEDEPLSVIEQVAVSLAREAGAELERRFTLPQSVTFKSSHGRDPVTEADLAVQSLIQAAIAQRFPDHAFLGEEDASGADSLRSGGPEPSCVWVVDPLDGTANFANGLPIFAVSIAVLSRGRPVVAALYTSFGPDGQRCVLHAHQGSGLKRDGVALLRATAAERGRLVGVPAGFHRRVRQRLLRRPSAGETRSLGSIAVELGLAACGRLSFAFFGGPKIWDVAAGVLLVQESGGAVLVTERGRWRRFRAFRAAPGRPLRRWRGSMMAGDVAVMRDLVGRTRLRQSPLERLERLLGTSRADQIESATKAGVGRARTAGRVLSRIVEQFQRKRRS